MSDHFEREEQSMSQDADHLRLLSIFHYVLAGLAALFSCFPLIHFFMGLAMLTGVFPDMEPAGNFMGGIFMAFSALVILAGWVFALLVFLTGRFLAARRNYTFCLVMAAVECMFMPFGTVLGVLTIIVLLREPVKAMFAAPPPAAV